MLVMVSLELGMALVRLPLSFLPHNSSAGGSHRCLNSTNELAARRYIGSCFYGRTLECVRCPLPQQAMHALLVGPAWGGGGDCKLFGPFAFLAVAFIFFL